MERRIFCVSLMVFGSSLFLLAGTASAHGARAKAAGTETTTCAVHSLSSFTEQGEGAEASTVGDVVEVECNPEEYSSGQKVRVSAHQLFSRCKGKLTWVTPTDKVTTGETVTLTVDDDGNATVAAIAGGGCGSGESLISAHLLEVPYETVSTAFKVLPPTTTPPGVMALPATQVEDDVHSSVETIIEAEFPSKYAEKTIHISAEELFSRCQKAPHMVVIGPKGTPLDSAEGSIAKVKLDDNGNAFVLVLGDSSCASGPTVIEADLETTPFTTYTTTFEVLSPRPTPPF